MTHQLDDWHLEEPSQADEPPDPGEVRAMHRGQLRMAYRLAAAYKDRLLHVNNVGWYAWDGARWARDDRGAAPVAVFATLKAALTEAVALPTTRRNELLADVRRCESAAGVDGVLKLASVLDTFATVVADLDPDPYLLNTTKGTVDLRTGESRPAEAGDRITKVCGAGYDPAATSDGWEKFLEDVLPDQDVREFLRRLMGLSLVGKVIEHVLPILTGTGRNGKGTFVRTIGAAFGDYAIEAEPELFLARDRAHPTGQLDLRGVRLATCQETDAGKRLAVATVKRLTGGDPIRARAMRRDFVEFMPSHLPVMITNHLPRVPADDPALWARLLVVPFNVSFLGREDTGLGDRLELELDGVLAWAIAGYRDYCDQGGLSAPVAVKAATESYQASSDAVAQFIEDRCVTGNGYYVKSSELWDAWSQWCRAGNEEPGTQRQFKALMESRGFNPRHGHFGTAFAGLGLTTEDEEEDSQ